MVGEVGDRLRAWARQGVAAGNVGDYYENRDGGHSALDLSAFPQLQAVVPDEPQARGSEAWGLRTEPLPYVVIGNSSTASPPATAGSNARRAYASEAGLLGLAQQYRANNLYVYPEHRDHDAELHGDVFPTNTPYLVISQGSSGSDQPFLRAIAATLAAFRPEVKAKLVEDGLLMPTLQLILRSSSRRVRRPEDYLTGVAHPTAFDGRDLVPAEMIERAQGLRLDALPPLVRLELREADDAERWLDYFDAAPSEELASTEAVIARVYRSMAASRRLVVSAEASVDPNGRPLRYDWVLLRGDPDAVSIRPLDAAGATVEIRLRHHPRAPIRPGHALHSNRVDVGVFVHNGLHYSAPGFVTSYTLSNEARTYDAQGRVLEVGYGMGEARFRVTDWRAFLSALSSDLAAARLVRSRLVAPEIAALPTLARRLESAMQAAGEAEEAKRLATAALEAAEPAERPELERAAQRAVVEARLAAQERDALLERTLGGGEPDEGAEGARARILELLRSFAQSPTFVADHGRALGRRPAVADVERARLVALGIVRDAEDDASGLELLPLLPGAGPAAERLSHYQRAQLARLHGRWLAFGLPGVEFEVARHVVDFAISARKPWRDVYRHDGSGARLGWTRYSELDPPAEFTHDGVLVLTRDAHGRPALGRRVQYGIPERARKREPWKWPPLSFLQVGPEVRYDYAGDDDLRGFPAPRPF